MKTNFLTRHNSFSGTFKKMLLGLSILLLTSHAYAGELNLVWDVSTSTNVGGYKLYYGSSSRNYTSAVDVGNVTSYKMTGLTDGGTYYFSLKSYNLAKSIESVSFSNEVSATIPTVPTVIPLTLNFTPTTTTGTAPLIVAFTPTANQNITNYSWDFGVPNVANDTSSAANATYTYNIAGTYTVSLTATSVGGTITTTKQIIVAPAPVTPPPVVVTPPPVVVTPPTQPQVTTSDLVAAFGFDEMSDSTATDASGYGNHGVITEAISTSGYFGRARKFDGVNDWVTVNDSSSLDLSTELTLEAWVKPAVLMNDWMNIIMKEQPGDEVYTLYANNSNTNTPMGAQWINGGITSYTGGSNLAPNTWWHLAVTYDGQFQRLYINGELKTTRNQSGLIQQSNGALRIGGDSIWGEYFNGLIDEVRIYKRALSEKEIQVDLITPISKPVIGENKLGTTEGEVAQGKAEAYKTVSLKPSVLTAIQVYLDTYSMTAQLVAGIYSDNKGHPGALLAQGKIAYPKAGATNTVAIPTVKLEASKPYWITILGAKGAVKFRTRADSTVATEINATKGLTSLPKLWGTGIAAPIAGPFSAYGSGY